MAMSPIGRERARILALAGSATLAVAGAAPVPARAGAIATEYELLRAELGNDLRRLSEIQSTEGKVALKRELAPKYDAWVEGVLAAEAAGRGGAVDDIVAWQLIWRVDIGAFDAALPLAAYLLRHNLTLPDRFDRTVATYIAEDVAEAALKRIGQGPDPEKAPDAEIVAERGNVRDVLATLDRVDSLVDGRDIFDQVRAKLEKAQGLTLLRLVDLTSTDADGPAGFRRAAMDRARGHIVRALELDSASGVKKRLEQLDRAIAKAAEPPAGGAGA